MSKIVLGDVGTDNTITQVNQNNAKIEEALNDKVLYREAVPGTSNEMKTNLDMNSNRIYNLSSPVSNTEPVRLKDLKDWNGTGLLPATADDVTFRPYLGITDLNVQDAMESIVDSIANIDVAAEVKEPTVTAIPNFTLNSSTPDGRYPIATTGAAGWNLLPSSKVVDFEVEMNSYFTANPNGHIAILARTNTAILATTLVGQGMIIGKVLGDEGNSASFTPTTAIETWRNPNAVPNRWIYPDTDGSPGQPMVDGGRYRIILTTTKHVDGSRTIGYKRYKWNTSWNAWDLEVDTGDILDNNTTADLSNEGLALGFVASSNLVPWSVPVTNIKVTWCAPIPPRTDSRAVFTRYGGTIKGDVSHAGHVSYASKNLYLQSGGPPSTWTKFIDKTAGNDTKLLVTPNKASGVAAVLLANNSNPASCAYLSFGMYSNYASIHCATEGGAAAPTELRFSIDGDVSRALKATSSGIYAPGATLPLGINNSIMAAVYNLGGTNARSFTNNSPLDLEQLSTIGQITSYLTGGGVFTNAQADKLEGLFRPLFSILSVCVASARNKGTM